MPADPTFTTLGLNDILNGGGTLIPVNSSFSAGGPTLSNLIGTVNPVAPAGGGGVVVGAGGAAGGAAGATAAPLPTFAQVEQAFFEANGRWAQGDELNVWARENGIPAWAPSAPAPRPTTGTVGGVGGVGAVNPVDNGDPGAHARNLLGEGYNTLAAQIALAPQAFQAYSQFSPQYAQQDLINLRNTLFGSVDAGTFLEAHPEFKQGYNDARARGEDPQAWLNKAAGSSTYLDQGNIKRGGGLFDINKALTTEANAQTVAANTALRGGNMADASMFGPQALELLKTLNPNQYSALEQTNQTAMTGMAPNAYQTQLGQTFAAGPQFERATYNFGPLSADLQRMARDELALGRDVSQDALRMASQSEREAWSARGLAFSPGAVADEILARDDIANKRLRERQAFASGVEGLMQGQQGLSLQTQLANQGAGLQAQQQNQNLGMGLSGMEYGRQQQNFGNQMANAQLQAGAAFNPFATVNSASSANQGTNPAMFNMGGGVSSGGAGNQGVQSMFNPFNAYAADVYGTNYNAEEAAKIAAGNNSAAKQGSIVGGVAKLGAAAIGTKVFFACVPEGEMVDTPNGPVAIQKLHAGDTVIGYGGLPVAVLQKHEYAENPSAIRFYRFFVNGGSFAVCDKHRIKGVRAEHYTDAESVVFGGVTRSYDLLTEDLGYRMCGIPVNSMIEEMAVATAQLMEAS